VRVMIGIWHPADVHFFKHVYRKLEQRGHEVLLTLRPKDVARELLDVYGLPYTEIGEHKTGGAAKALNLLSIWRAQYRVAREFRPDIMLGEADMYSGLVSKLVRCPFIDFCNNEHARLENLLSVPMASVVVSPASYEKRYRIRKHIRYNSYPFLGYLHPDYFKPDPAVLDELSISKGERFAVVRFVGWGAAHDAGHKDFKYRESLIQALEQHCRVFITSEDPLPEGMEDKRLEARVDRIHDLLHYASIYVGEGGTMACEAAGLGTPSVFTSDLHLGYLAGLQERYGLVRVCADTGSAIDAIDEILADPSAKKDWAIRRHKLFEDTEDLVAFVVDLAERYPQSVKERMGGA